MRISLNWLQELVSVNLGLEELANLLTMAGFEVEEIEDQRTKADGVVIGRVLDCQPHPNADKLRVCSVDIGQSTPSNIVCGAANVRNDIFVPVATIGTYLPAVNLKLKPVKLRGVPSQGMICSLSELGMEKESEGIYIFNGDNLVPGQDVRPLLGLDDVIIHISTTANRADALSMVGIAREISALTGANVTLPSVVHQEIPQRDIHIEVTNTQACPAYSGTVVTGVKIASSPEWLQRRLKAAGVRPINNVVDVTNYVMLEWGQPLHGFDYIKLQELVHNEPLNINVRFSGSDEQLTTLDGQKRTLKAENLLICANNNPVALAGVMGGENTEVDSNTQEILLEAALFEPIVVRKSARSQGLRSESSTRYERGVNQVEWETARTRAISLITQLAGGAATAQVSVDSRQGKGSNAIELRLSRIHQVLGKVKLGETIRNIEPQEVEEILTALGCTLEQLQPELWRVVVPGYRYRDLEREIDLVEEVARLFGYDKFLATLPSQTLPGYLSPSEAGKRAIRNALQAVGLTEVVHYSLVKPVKDEVVLSNPLYAEYSALRTNLLDGLIEAFEYNLAQDKIALNAFEVGRVFKKAGEDVQEIDLVGGIMGGELLPEGRWVSSGKGSPMSWYEAKGILEAVFTRLGITVIYQKGSTYEQLHPNRTASLWIGDNLLGVFGQLHPLLRNQKGFPEAVYGFELNFAVLLAAISKDDALVPHFKPFSTYPPVARDMAFFATEDLCVAEITKVMHKAGNPLLETVVLFDEYRGVNVPEGHRSLAFSLVYRVSHGTLTEEQVEPVHQKVRDTLVQKFNVSLRS